MLTEKSEMKIKSIRIKNVRGIKEKAIQLEMIPNKPSILVAPNGAGKSSFAFAFQWLNRQRMKLDEADAYGNDINNKPELIIMTDEDGIERSYLANESSNTINRKFGVFVINNGLKASSPGVHNGTLMGKSKIVVPDIELLPSKPEEGNLHDDFDNIYDTADAPQGMYPSISMMLTNHHFMSLCDYDNLKLTTRQARLIKEQIDLIKTYTGTIQQRHNKVITDNKDVLEQIVQVKHVCEIIRHFFPKDTDVKILLKAIKIVTLAYRQSDVFKKRVEYANYKINEESTRKLFESIKRTWKGIKPHREHDKLILRIGDAQRISNGERDILILLGMLQKAKNSFTKQDNILIIDDVFDYLDDANLIAAQHYVNLFINDLKDDGKNIYPIILSHINPSYFRTFAFKDMKVYYLNPLQYPNASDNMMKLVRKRDEWERNEKTKADLISKYMLHYNPNYTRPMNDVIDMDTPNWNDIPTFKNYCLKQTEEYLDGRKYDSLAVCVALREMIEKICYSKLHTAEQRTFFLDKAHGTEAKIDYVETLDIVIPETFSLLGLVYNDPLHPNSKNKIDLRQTLYSRLENKTICGMIGEIKKMYDAIS